MLKSKFTGEARVFRKDFGGKPSYSVQISKKNLDGNWDNAWLYAKFKKGVSVPNRATLNVTNGWLDFYLNKEGNPVFGVFINEYDNLDEIAGYEEVAENLPF